MKMAKRYGFNPFVILGGMDIPEDDPVSGGGSGQSGVKVYPCSYSDWLERWPADLVGPAGIDFEDYRQWWINNGFSEEAWAAYNTGPLNPGDNSDPLPPDDGNVIPDVVDMIEEGMEG